MHAANVVHPARNHPGTVCNDDPPPLGHGLRWAVFSGLAGGMDTDLLQSTKLKAWRHQPAMLGIIVAI
jgi:hypothetical protein